MIIEISGQGEVDYRFVKSLIADFIRGEECTHFYLPISDLGHGRSLGLHNTEEAIRRLADTFPIKIYEIEEDDQADILFTLDADFDADKVGNYLESGKKVFDLGKALYPVTS